MTQFISCSDHSLHDFQLFSHMDSPLRFAKSLIITLLMFLSVHELERGLIGVPEKHDFNFRDEEQEDDGLTSVLLDGWLNVRMDGAMMPSLAVLRSRLANCFAARVANPRAQLSRQQNSLIETASACFMAEGHSCGLDPAPSQRNPAFHAPQNRYVFSMIPSLVHAILISCMASDFKMCHLHQLTVRMHLPPGLL